MPFCRQQVEFFSGCQSKNYLEEGAVQPRLEAPGLLYTNCLVPAESHHSSDQNSSFTLPYRPQSLIIEFIKSDRIIQSNRFVGYFPVTETD